MKPFNYVLTIGMAALGLAMASPDALAQGQPVCILEQNPVVLLVGQVGAPGNPLVVGGYLIAGFQKNPLIGSVSIGTDGSVDVGYTTHFNYGSAGWQCPVASTVIKATAEGVTYDTTYIGGPEADGCPENHMGDVQVISCEGLYPYDPGDVPFITTPGAATPR